MLNRNKTTQSRGSDAKKAPPAPPSPNANALVAVAADRMSATIVLVPPSEGGKPLSEEIILAAISGAGVEKGIKLDYIERFIKHPVYGTKFLIAEGKLAADGKDEELVCFFEASNNLAPRVLEDGSTDYKNIGFGHSVQEGELVAELMPAVHGQNGFDVLGHDFIAKSGVPLNPRPNGTNVRVSEDGRQIFAVCGGNVSLKDKKVNVRKEMLVDHVDQTTGNIVFSGDLNITGDIRDGYTVRAGGSITVGGVVESATVVAGRDIVIKTGIHGEDSIVTAGGGLRTGYIEMGTIKVKECIYADVVINAQLTSEDKIILSGKRGCIIGGSARAGHYFEAKIIGNDANAATLVEIVEPGIVNPEKEEMIVKVRECGERVAMLNDEWRAATVSDLPIEERKEIVSELVRAKRDAEAELRGLTATLAQMTSEDEAESKGLLLVHEHIFPNVTMNIDGTLLRNTFMRPACRVTRKKDKLMFGTHN